MTLRHVLITVLTTLCCLTAAEAAPYVGTRTREYTKEDPLVYEDSWRKWPYAFINDEGEADGFNVELMRRVLSRLDIPFEIRLRDQEEVHEDLRNDSADISLGVAADYNAPFGRFGRFTICHFNNAILLPKKDSVAIITPQDLFDIPFYVRQNSRAYHCLKEAGLPDSMLHTADNMEIEILERYGAEDMYPVWNAMMLKWVVNKYHLDNYCVVPVDITAGEYRFMSGDTVLLARLDSVCTVMYQKGEIQEMLSRWMNPGKEKHADIYTYIVIVALIVFVLGLIINFIYHRLQKYHAEDQLADSKKQLDLILSSNNISIWVYYPGTRRYSWMSSNGMTDREYSTYEFSRFFPDEEFSAIHSHVTDIVKNDGNICNFKLRSFDRTSQSKIRDIELRIIPMRNDYGKIYCIFGMQHDITDTKAMLDRKQRMHKRHTNAFNLTVGSILRFDGEGRLKDINEHLQKRRLRLSDKSILINKGFVITDLNHIFGIDVNTCDDDVNFISHVPKLPDITTALPVGNTQVAADGSTMTSATIDGEPLTVRELEAGRLIGAGYFNVHIIKTRGNDSNVTGYMVFLRDITEYVKGYRTFTSRQRNIDYFKNEQDVYRKCRNFILKETNIEMLHYYPETRMVEIFDWKTGGKRLFSLLQLLEYIDERDLKEIFKAFHHVDARNPKELNFEVRTLFKNRHGNPKSYKVSCHPVFDKEGMVETYFSICVDITEQVNMESKLKKETVKARDVEMMKQNFLKNMSYSIRQPLVVMRQKIDMLNSVDGEDEMPLLESVCNNTHRLIHLSDDTLLLSRIEAGMMQLELKELDFVQLYQSSIEAGLKHFRKVGVTYNVQNTYNTLPVVADAKVLSRILSEAAALSARYTNYGTINIHYIYRRDQLNIAIEDTGEGIPPGELDTLFEPQIGITHIMSESSQTIYLSGLEMPICKALVEMLHGKIDIESDPGHGTSIFIAIPI